MAPTEPDAEGDAAQDTLHILYGSQTGTAEETAWDLAREAARRGLRCADPRELNEVSVPALTGLRTAMFVVATTGQGDPPVNMRRLWQDLLDARLPATLLAGLRFAVFGLGDSHYREFNYAARKLHARLKQLGAEPFWRLGLGDDQHDFGMEQELDPWAEGAWAALADCAPQLRREPAPEALAAAEGRRYDVEVLGSADAPDAPNGAARARDPAGDEFEAEVCANWSLCSQEHARDQQDVRNVCLRLPPGRRYEAGDVCVVWPQADQALVRRFVVETLGLQLETLVRIVPTRRAGAGTDGPFSATSAFPEEPLTLEELFTSHVDISAVPSRHFFHVLSRHTDHELHKKKLSEFASRTLEAKDALYEYCKRERRSAAEVMWDFWTARPPLAELVSCLPPMRPRRYSIASCPRWYEEEPGLEGSARFWLRYREVCAPAWAPRCRGRAAVAACASAIRELDRRRLASERGARLDLCVAVVRFTTKTGREGRGLCSSFLERAAWPARVRCGLEKGSLALPPLGVPLILVCPGTGLSPCRALVQERHLQLASSADAAGATGRFRAGLRDLMFLGFRHQAGDFLYGEEWAAFAPWLAVHVAFSRDHEDRKVYVQDLIEEHGAHVCSLLDAGARVFVCGRAHPMPAQVFDAFTEVLQVHRGLSQEGAAQRLREMQRAQRYICDTWG